MSNLRAREVALQILRTCLQSRGTLPEYPYFCAKNKSEHDAYRDMESARCSLAAKNMGVLERGKIVATS